MTRRARLLTTTAARTDALVIPSVPGFGFSGALGETGWDILRVGRAWSELMRHLGYERYVAQGGDLRAFASLVLAGMDHEHVVGQASQSS